MHTAPMIPTRSAPARPVAVAPRRTLLGQLGAAVLALVDGRPQPTTVVFREVRFKIGLECPCGRKVDLHQAHEQHMCGCGIVYRMDGVASGAVAWLRAQRT